MKYLKCAIILMWVLLISSLCLAGFSVSPIKTELELRPGERYDGTIVVTRDPQDKCESISVSYKEWYTLEENKDIKISDWLKFENTDVKFDKNKNIAEVNYIINVPTTAVGQIMAMVSFSPNSHNNDGFTPVYSVPIYVFILGKQEVKPIFENIELRRENDGMFSVILNLRAEGNVLFRPYGQIVFFDKKHKQQVAVSNIEAGWPVYPGKSRVFIGKEKVALDNGRYWIDLQLSYKKAGKHSKFIEDKYKLKITDKDIRIKL